MTPSPAISKYVMTVTSVHVSQSQEIQRADAFTQLCAFTRQETRLSNHSMRVTYDVHLTFVPSISSCALTSP